MSKHTPGPWIVDGDDISPAHDETLGICAISPVDVGGGKGWFRGVQTHSNAHLIAAAPDLLEALLLARQTIEDKCAERGHGCVYSAREIMLQEFKLIDAAIAKARGEA